MIKSYPGQFFSVRALRRCMLLGSFVYSVK